MPRPKRHAPGGVVYHVINRARGGATIFPLPEDYELFLRVLRASQRKMVIRLLAYCVMPNHWHLVLWPYEDGDLSRFMQRLTGDHARRWHLARVTTGTGHVYQGRFKSFPIQDDRHFFTVCRYVERNALRGGLCNRAEQWPWGSLHERFHLPEDRRRVALSAWPVDPPEDWIACVNEPQTRAELEAVRRSVERSRPFGDPAWQKQIAARLRLESTLRTRGRPGRHDA